jgi:hypothetical protein
LQNSADICASANRVTALFDGQNGKTADLRPLVQGSCAGKKGKARKGERGSRRRSR